MSNEKPVPAGPQVNRAALAVLGIWLTPVMLSLLPNYWRSIRAIGITLDWWYFGVVAPVLIVALVLHYGTHRHSSG